MCRATEGRWLLKTDRSYPTGTTRQSEHQALMVPGPWTSFLKPSKTLLTLIHQPFLCLFAILLFHPPTLMDAPVFTLMKSNLDFKGRAWRHNNESWVYDGQSIEGSIKVMKCYWDFKFEFSQSHLEKLLPQTFLIGLSATNQSLVKHCSPESQLEASFLLLSGFTNSSLFLMSLMCSPSITSLCSQVVLQNWQHYTLD